MQAKQTIMHFFIKVILSALIIAGVSELGKKFTTIAAILASLPLLSILAMVWLYTDTKEVQKVIDLSSSIFWMVLPSMVFFFVLPLLLKNGIKFTWAMLLSTAIMFATYSLYIYVLGKLGIKI